MIARHRATETGRPRKIGEGNRLWVCAGSAAA
jgi:hypothetical protein